VVVNSEERHVLSVAAYILPKMEFLLISLAAVAGFAQLFSP
jgi:hypothetical protein